MYLFFVFTIYYYFFFLRIGVISVYLGRYLVSCLHTVLSWFGFPVAVFLLFVSLWGVCFLPFFGWLLSLCSFCRLLVGVLPSSSSTPVAQATCRRRRGTTPRFSFILLADSCLYCTGLLYFSLFVFPAGTVACPFWVCYVLLCPISPLCELFPCPRLLGSVPRAIVTTARFTLLALSSRLWVFLRMTHY